MNFIKKWLIKRELNKIRAESKQKSPVEVSLDEYVKDSMKRHSDALRTADKLLKAKLLNRQAKETLHKIEELSDDDDYEDEEEDEDFGDDLLKGLVQKFLTSKAQNSSQDNPVSNFTPSKFDEIKGTLTPEQKKWVKDNYGFSL